MSDKDRLLMYEGKDPNLLEHPRCFQCSKTPATKLLRCSRCRVAWYCSAVCQKEHYPKHREFCKIIDRQKNYILQEEIRLRYSPEIEDVFISEIGNFWDFPHTRPHMEATYDMANWYRTAAYQSDDVKEVWEKALFYILEHLRVGAIDKKGARWRAPFFLLNLNRDDDTYSFIRYWVKLKGFLFSNPGAMLDIHLDSNEGDWIYPREADCRYLDIFQDISNDPQKIDLAFLVALAIIKLRIVAAYHAAVNSIGLAFEGTAGRIHEVQSKIKEMLVRDDVNVENEEDQVNRLLDAIHLKNATVIPALIYPKPLIEQPHPTRIILGHPSEAYMIVKDSMVCLDRVPGATELLEERFGYSPVYNWNVT